MAFETGLTNEPTPIQNLGQASGRLVKEDNLVVNAADFLSEVTTPGSGVNLNVDVSIDPTPNSRSKASNDTSKILFSADFTGGFDNFYDWVCGFKTLILSPNRNATFTIGGDSIGPVVISTGRLPIVVDCAGPAETITDVYSNNFLKIGNSGRCFAELGGVFQIGGTANTTSFAIKLVGETPIPQANWNTDTFTMGGLNPSGKVIDFTKVQCVVHEFYNKDHGDIRVGFLIEDIIYYAHIFKVNNNMGSFTFGDLNLPVRDTIYRDASSVTREIGVMDDVKGVSFVSTMDTTNDPTLIATYFLNSCVVYSVGDDSKDLRKPFTFSYSDLGGQDYRGVGDPVNPTPIIAVKAKNEIYPGVVNRTVYGVSSVTLSTRSANLDDSAVFSIGWHGDLPGVYSSVNEFSAIEGTIPGGYNPIDSIVLKTVIVSGNQNITLKKEDFISDYANNFSFKSVNISGEGVKTNARRGTFFILAKPAFGVDIIEVSASISGFETA